jgi:hypothetical protein
MPDTTTPGVNMADEKSLSSQFDKYQQHPRRRWTCPSDEAIASYVDGSLASTSKSGLENHLAKCQRCREIVANTVKDQRENDPPVPPSTLLFKIMRVASTQQRSRNWFWIPAGAAAMIVVVLLVISGLLRQPRQALISTAHMPSAPRIAKSEPAIVPQESVRDIVRTRIAEEALPSVIFPKTGSVVAGQGTEIYLDADCQSALL